jgi:hypothetical protein
MDLLPCVDDIEGIVCRGLTAATRDDAHQESYEDDSAHVESLALAYANAALLFWAAIVAPSHLLQGTARSARVHSPSTPIRLPSAPESLSR